MSLEDRAQEQELMAWERNNRPRTEPARYAPTDAKYGPEFCQSCDDDMPVIRRAYGYTVCVDCKTKQENHARTHRY